MRGRDNAGKTIPAAAGTSRVRSGQRCRKVAQHELPPQQIGGWEDIASRNVEKLVGQYIGAIRKDPDINGH